eukprot:7977323-Lingulodinium_polyedra.AAC.1
MGPVALLSFGAEGLSSLKQPQARLAKMSRPLMLTIHRGVFQMTFLVLIVKNHRVAFGAAWIPT